MLASPIIEIKNLSAGYDNRTVLHDVNLTIYERDFLGIIGCHIIPNFPTACKYAVKFIFPSASA